MASLRPTRRLAHTLLGATLAASLAACNAGSLFSLGAGIKKLYVKDYTLSVDARLIAGASSKTFEDAKIQNVRSLGNVGVVYSPNYLFVAEPTLLLASTSPVTFSSSDTVTEPAGYDATGAQTTQTVLRKPLFVLNKVTLSYAVPGYTIAPVTITEDLPIKDNTYTLKLAGVAQVNELSTAFAKDPTGQGTVVGTVTFTLEVLDTDPLASEKIFTVARSVPFVYSYSPFTPATDTSSAGGSSAPAGGSTPVGLPSLAIPTAPPTATPVPSPTATTPTVGSVS